MRTLCWLVLVAGLFSGCTSVTRFHGLTLSDDALFVSDVAPIRQDRAYACGPACVAAVAAHWGVSPAEFKAQIRESGDDATADDLQQMATRLGLRAFAYQGSMDDLRQNLEKGRPVIAMIPQPLPARGGWLAGAVFNLWNEWGPRPPHWVVVVGEFGDGRIIIHDPASGPLLVKTERFLAWWRETDRLCLLIAGHDEPAATNGPAPVAQAAPGVQP